MNASRTTTSQADKPSPSEDKRPGLRTKTVAMRLTPDELTDVESAAERGGKPLSEWLRDTALTAARGCPADPVELVLAELWAVRHALLNLFYAGAQAAAKSEVMSSESILQIRDRTDARKLDEARKMLGNFLAVEVGNGGDRS